MAHCREFLIGIVYQNTSKKLQSNAWPSEMRHASQSFNHPTLLAVHLQRLRRQVLHPQMHLLAAVPVQGLQSPLVQAQPSLLLQLEEQARQGRARR